MGKTVKDLEFDLERQLSFALHAISDDAAYAKIESRDVEVIILRTLSSAVCTMAYVAGLSKESFLHAVSETWDNTKEAANEAAKKIEEYVEKYKEEIDKMAPVQEEKKETIKN